MSGLLQTGQGPQGPERQSQSHVFRQHQNPPHATPGPAAGHCLLRPLCSGGVPGLPIQGELVWERRKREEGGGRGCSERAVHTSAQLAQRQRILFVLLIVISGPGAARRAPQGANEHLQPQCDHQRPGRNAAGVHLYTPLKGGGGCQ